jgi:predicted dehydrogenase
VAGELLQQRQHAEEQLAKAGGAAIDLWRKRLAQTEAQIADEILAGRGKTPAEKFGYQGKQITDAAGNVVYDCPAIEELIRWRLWDRTGAGLMAELGSHQLDAASIFIAAVHGGAQQPLSVAAAGNRSLFCADRDIEDHVCCIFEFPAPGYDAKDPIAAAKKIGVQYASINGSGFEGYGETVLGTEGTLVLEREREAMLFKVANTTGKIKVVAGKKSSAQPVLELFEGGDEQSAAVGRLAMLQAQRGYAEELEHWAWCIRNPAAENLPHCHPTVALGDAVIALTANKAAREGSRIDFRPEWFDPDRDETPEGIKPNLNTYPG